MSALFEDLMEGLDAVEAYLNGQREGYVVHVLAEAEGVERLDRPVDFLEGQ